MQISPANFFYTAQYLQNCAKNELWGLGYLKRDQHRVNYVNDTGI